MPAVAPLKKNVPPFAEFGGTGPVLTKVGRFDELLTIPVPEISKKEEDVTLKE